MAHGNMPALTSAQRHALLHDLRAAGVTDALLDDPQFFDQPTPVAVPEPAPQPASQPKTQPKIQPVATRPATEPAAVWSVGEGGRLTILTAAEHDLQDSPYPYASEELTLLTKMLSALKIDGDEITHVAMSVTDANGQMLGQQALQAAHDNVQQACASHGPILVFGQKAAQALLNQPSADLQSLRRQNMQTVADRPVCVTYHPRLLLKQQAYKRPAWDDLQQLIPHLT